MAGRRILVVNYVHPPIPSVGGNRWAALATHLGRLGHEVTILTTGAYGAVAGEYDVVRTTDLNASPLLRRLLGRPALPPPGAPAIGEERPPPAILTGVLVPDAFVVSWLPAALITARRLLRSRRYDCIVTSSPFESTHLLGLLLGERRPPWVADFRDGWCFESLRPRFATRAQRALDRALERRVALGADAATAATPPIAEDLERRLGAATAWVLNGWDPELEPEVAIARPPDLEPGRVNLVHTGTLSGGWGRDPGPFLDALAQLRAREPELGDRLCLVLAGRARPEEDRAIAARGLQHAVRRVGQLPRAESLSLQRRADALLLVTSRNRSEATGKVFEYLVAGRPILALAHGNVAARLIQETRTGVTVAPDDVDAIAGALASLARGELGEEYAPRGLERYVQPGPAHEMLAAIERACRTASAVAVAEA